MVTAVLPEAPAKPSHRRWSEDEIEYLSDNYGRVEDRLICQQLNRSLNGIVIASKRKLSLARKDNIYTAREVARLLGCDSKTIVWWIDKGWLKGKKGAFYQGLNRVWDFQEGDIAECLKRRPWLVDLKRMETSFFRSIVKEEMQKDPWYTASQAAPLLGVKTDDEVLRYCRKGWLPAEKKPGGPHQWRWIIRRSAIEGFLANDPRPQYRRKQRAEVRRNCLLAQGRPVRMSINWLIRCPSCRQEIMILADPRYDGPDIKRLFLEKYSGCSHGDFCEVS